MLVSALLFLSVFYIVYFIKMLLLSRQGITGNLLGKGDKPKIARTVENLLRTVTVVGAIIQFGSAAFPALVWSVPVIMPVRWVGIFLLFLGNAFFCMAVITMRENWRAGFDNNQATSLVTHGIYRISRNPAFVGFDLLYIGCAAAFPNPINITSAIVAVILFHIQILGEEVYCTAAFGQTYTDYALKTMRYLGRRPIKPYHLHHS